MSTTTDTKSTVKTAAEVCKKFQLSAGAAKLLRDGLQPRMFLDLLTQNQHNAAAVRFMAHSMSKREAIWWACWCARPEKGGTLAPPAAEGLKAAEAWVAGPTDELRRAAHAAAPKVGVGTPV